MHLDTARSLSKLALLLGNQRDYAGARPLHERALAMIEKALGPEHAGTAASLNNLALVLQAQGDLAAARPLFERALAIAETTLGPEHPQTAVKLNNLAHLLQAQGDLARDDILGGAADALETAGRCDAERQSLRGFAPQQVELVSKDKDLGFWACF
jgi:tetratricopeptide (TPR) repeat protein